MNDRLDTFIDALLEALQPHGGCQCGCAVTVLGAIAQAKQAVSDADDAEVEVHAAALDSTLDT